MWSSGDNTRMDRGTRNRAEGVDYEPYDSHYSHSDPTTASTNSPDLDIYLSTYDRSKTEAHSSRGQGRGWVLVAVGGTFLLAIGLVVIFMASSSTFRRLGTEGEKRNAPAASQAQGKRVLPDTSRPSAPQTAGQGHNLIPSVAKGVVLIHAANSGEVSENSGTGFFIDQRGYVLTNEHVIHGKNHIVVTLHDRTDQAASVVAADQGMDIAILKLSGAFSAPALSLGDSDAIRLGDAVYVLGFPLESKLGSALTVTNGLVSSIRQRKGEPWFQISAAVNPGNSGGPLIRADSGAVVGVVTSKLADAELIAFARPINSIRQFVARHVR